MAGFSKPTSAANADFAAARYDRAGNLDPSFGTGGLALFDLGSDDIVHAAALAQDGKLVLAGVAWHGRDDGHFALVRLTADGRPDAAFNGSGALVVDGFLGAANDVAIDGDGAILAAGYAIVEGRTAFAVVRCLDDGRLDDTFGVDGVMVLDLGGVKTWRTPSRWTRSDGFSWAARAAPVDRGPTSPSPGCQPTRCPATPTQGRLRSARPKRRDAAKNRTYDARRDVKSGPGFSGRRRPGRSESTATRNDYAARRREVELSPEFTRSEC